MGTPLLEIRNQAKLGTVFDVVIKKSDLSVSGLLVKTNKLIDRPRVVVASDILEVNPEGVVINNAGSLVSLGDVVRLSEAIHQGYHGLHQKVITRSGKRIGWVFDYLISSTDLTITKLYIQTLFYERIIPVSVITKFEGRKIIISDDFEFASLAADIALEAEAA